MNKIFQTICVLVLMTFSCFGSIVDYTTIGGGSSAFTGSYSNLTGLPYTITLTNTDGTIILTSLFTNVTSSGTNITVNISDGPNTNALTANQTQIIARAITNIVAGNGILVTKTNNIEVDGNVVVTNLSQQFWNDEGNGNTFISINSPINTTGQQNVGIGDSSLFSAQSGNGNTAYGFGSLDQVSSGTYNIGLGNFSGNNITTTSSNIDIGSQGITGDFQVTRLGDKNTRVTYIGGINIIQNGANLATNSIAASSSTNLLATDSSGNEVTVPWSGLPAGGSVFISGTASATSQTNMYHFFTNNITGEWGYMDTNGMIFKSNVLSGVWWIIGNTNLHGGVGLQTNVSLRADTATITTGSILATNLATFILTQTNFVSGVSYLNTNPFPVTVSILSSVTAGTSVGNVAGFQLWYDNFGGTAWKTNDDGTTISAIGTLAMTTHYKLSGKMGAGYSFVFTNISAGGSSSLVPNTGQISSP